jgi:hypothetical protein
LASPVQFRQQVTPGLETSSLIWDVTHNDLVSGWIHR